MRSVARVQIPVSPPNKTDKCLLVRFCFTKPNNRDLNESVKKTTRCVVFSGCPKAFAKHKNISHGMLCKRQEQIPVSLCSETGILHDAAHRAACGVNPGSLIYPQAKKRKRRTVFVLTKNGAQQGARRLDKKKYL